MSGIFTGFFNFLLDNTQLFFLKSKLLKNSIVFNSRNFLNKKHMKVADFQIIKFQIFLKNCAVVASAFEHISHIQILCETYSQNRGTYTQLEL